MIMAGDSSLNSAIQLGSTEADTGMDRSTSKKSSGILHSKKILSQNVLMTQSAEKPNQLIQGITYVDDSANKFFDNRNSMG